MKSSQTSYHSRYRLPIILAVFSMAVFLTFGSQQPVHAQDASAEIQPDTDHHRGSHPAMGVLVRYELYGKSAAFPDAERILTETLEELENIFSDYRKDSEVNKLCRTAPHPEPVDVSKHFWILCDKSQKISVLTHGAFDVTIGPASHLWRAAIKRRRLPEPEKIEPLLNRIGYEKMLVLPDQKVQLTNADMQLDFGGIAKGYAADVILERLRELPIQAALIDVGGDVTVLGTPPGREFWRVQIGGGQEKEKRINLALSGGSVATSGDSEQRLLLDSVRYSHLVDPRSGQASTTSHLVTVIAEDGTTADALASAFSILSTDEIQQGAAKFPSIAYRIVYRESPDSAQLLIIESPDFSRFISDE